MTTELQMLSQMLAEEMTEHEADETKAQQELNAAKQRIAALEAEVKTEFQARVTAEQKLASATAMLDHEKSMRTRIESLFNRPAPPPPAYELMVTGTTETGRAHKLRLTPVENKK